MYTLHIYMYTLYIYVYIIYICIQYIYICIHYIYMHTKIFHTLLQMYPTCHFSAEVFFGATGAGSSLIGFTWTRSRWGGRGARRREPFPFQPWECETHHKNPPLSTAETC